MAPASRLTAQLNPRALRRTRGGSMQAGPLFRRWNAWFSTALIRWGIMKQKLDGRQQEEATVLADFLAASGIKLRGHPVHLTGPAGDVDLQTKDTRAILEITEVSWRDE